MSYLNAIRLVFSGRFQADPSTVNNDVRHYDNASFQPEYQDYQKGTVAEGWWNPSGSGAFRFLDCVVRSVHYADGSSIDDPTIDPVIGLSILDANSRTSGKIVDIDPQWQLASELWGLTVRLAKVTDTGATTYVGGKYAPNPFRDLWFSRASGLGGDAAASALFQSVLTGVDWADDLPDSRFLRELRGKTQGGKLSIRLVTYAYKDDHTQPGFTFGTVSGVIGPYLEGEPELIIVGRRFAPQNGQTTWNNIGFFTGVLGDDNRLLLDLCNALPIDANAQPLDLGVMTVGSLLAPTTPEGSPIGVGNYQPIGPVAYQSPDWLLKDGGIAEFLLTQDQLANQSADGQFTPLAVATQPAGAGVPMVAIRETVDGLFVGAEPFVLRIDSSDTGPVNATTTLYASIYGQPAQTTELLLKQSGPMPNLGGGYGTDQPTADIPLAGVPEKALSFPHAVETGAAGTTAVTIQATPPRNPRGYIDGQLYNILYRMKHQTRQAFGQFEVIALHLRDAYPVPERPTWLGDIKPIFQQYANLYPIMSQRLVHLNDPLSVYRHREILSLAFSLDITDPNYMPVTRDLSEGKRQTIVKWLRHLDQDQPFLELCAQAPAVPTQQPPAQQRSAQQPSGQQPKARRPVAATAEAASPPAGGKTTFAGSYAKAIARAKFTSGE
ncbi:hypothetical protein [Nitrospirillum sp. BR 11163]|uniref:hypothetical protein n=1 Tax=Nitrospirillum sp. BR 11163 TaxID=3104323 RepID=UPI002B000B92|nr:hypothetical protein [Nitrospirillum sp. BR 11163]MEA1675983.1 hypothetical protein [Nitrospirillum sp. BR 11163]